MINEPPFGNSLLEERLAAPNAFSLVRWYAKPTVKLNIDNIVTSLMLGAGTGCAINAAGLQSPSEVIGAGVGSNFFVYPLVYSITAYIGHRVLASIGLRNHSPWREIIEGNAASAPLSIVYEGSVGTMEYWMLQRGIDPGVTVFASNVVMTTVMSLFRTPIYLALDRAVEFGKGVLARAKDQTPESTA